MKKKLVLIIFLCTFCFANAKTADSKNFLLNASDTFAVCLNVLSNLNYKIAEMQYSSGYILFKTPNNDEYLLMVSEYGSDGSNVKIIKANNSAVLLQIQQIVFDEISNEINNIPKKVQ